MKSSENRCLKLIKRTDHWLVTAYGHLQEAFQNALQFAKYFATHTFLPLITDSLKTRCLVCFGTPFLLLSASSIFAASWDDDFIWTIDVSNRTQYLTEDAPSRLGSFNSIGIDASGTISSDSRDIVTLNLQANRWCIDDLTRRPGFFKGEDDCETVFKVATANFSLSGDGKFNFLVGHPELPFGLEVPVSTNQTLRQTTNARDLGLKLDWGMGFNGTIGKLQYSTTYGRGSGMKYNSSKDPYSFAGRIGTVTDSQSFLGAPGIGVSVFMGDVLTREGTISERWRFGVDGIGYRGPFGLMGQLSVGETDLMDTATGLVEVNMINRTESIVGYVQLRSFNQEFESGWQDATSAIAGMRFTPTTNWAFSFQIEHEMTSFNRTEQTLLNLQFRYRL